MLPVDGLAETYIFVVSSLSVVIFVKSAIKVGQANVDVFLGPTDVECVFIFGLAEVYIFVVSSLFVVILVKICYQSWSSQCRRVFTPI